MRQSIPQSETKIPFAHSGGICAFPHCRRSLVEPGSSVDGALVVGEVAHKARMYNDLYLGEVNFWRDYLSKGDPRITLNFGNQSGVIEAALMRIGMQWPGIPGDEKTVGGPAQDDLFTLSDLAETVEGEEIDWTDEDEEDLEEDSKTDAD